MRYSPPEADKSRAQDRRAAIFVDYENLSSYLLSRIGPRGRPDDLITEMLDELRRHLLEEMRTQTAIISAYADFGEMHGGGQHIQRSLYLRGIEPRFVPATLQKNAAELQLCVDAIETIYTRPDLRTFVMVTGDRPYLPLVQQCRRYGCQVFIAMFATPPSTERMPGVDDDVFINALDLLSEPSRRAFAAPSSQRGQPAQAPSRPQPVQYLSITDEGAHQALEIIEEHFGQYEEVYLTPLLRKLSELLDEEKYDPKSLISELEDAGAVWLEKRRGFPYDYTVLLIDAQHPDVAAIQKEFYEREQSDAFERPYDDELDEHDDYYPEDEYGDEDEYIDEEEFADEEEYVDEAEYIDEDDEHAPSNGKAAETGTGMLDDLAEEEDEDHR